jgi:hypothetical protein
MEAKLPEPMVVVIPKGEQKFVFKCAPVMDFTEFEVLCPRPKPPIISRPGQQDVADITDKAYRAAMDTRGEKRFAYMVVKSMSATEGLEWDTVKLNDSSTWTNYHSDLIGAGFSDVEISKIVEKVVLISGFSEEMIEQATASFLVSQAQEAETQSSQGSEQ